MSKRIFTLLISLFFISWVSQAQPITQATAIKIIPVNGTATPPTTTTPFRFDWTAGTGTNNIIVVIRDSTRSFTPVNNTQYTANPDFSLGTNLGSGSGTAKVVYNGLSSALTVTDIINLQAGTTYLIRIYEYSGTLLGGNNDESYNLNPASGNPIYFKYHTTTPAGKWWTPAGVTAATVQSWGAGGAGGGTASDNSSINGGGGGAYASSPLTGLSGGYTITVGTGGTANETSGGQGGDGGNSSFGSSVIAVGGDGGGTGSTTGGFGGGGTTATAETAASTGVTRHAGGNGNSRIAGANTGGGGGGGSAGTTGAGQLGGIATAGGIGGIAGVAGANGGAAGGAGGDDGAIGVAGSFPGGGGGGQGYLGAGTTGSGAGGLVIVSYQPSAGLTSTASFTKNFIKNGTAQIVQVNFSAPVTGVPTITIDGDMSAPLFTNQVMTIGGDASVWTFNAGSTWANNGEVFKITVGTATNANGSEVNPNPASNSFTVDNTAPIVSLTSSDANLIVRDANTVTITATFIEANGLSGTPTISIPSTVTPVSGASMIGGPLVWTYSWNVPTGDDASVSVSISATDNAGNANTAATGSVTYTIDNIAPTTDQDAVFTASITQKGGTSVTLTGAGSSTEFVWFAPSGTTTFVAGPTMTTAAGDAASINAPANEGAYRLFALDAAGNPTAQSAAILTVDNTGPIISIGTPSAIIANNAASVTYTITYTGADNITLANGNISLNTTTGASATVDVTGSGTLTRTVTLTNFTGNGTVGISIASGTAVDLYTNLSLAAGPSGTITVDNTAPTNQDVVFASSKATTSGSAVTIVSSGNSTNRVWVAPAGTSVFIEGLNMTKSVNGTFTSILAPATEGSYVVYVLDESGNASVASTAILHVFSPATNLTYTVATVDAADQIKFNWTNGTGDGRVIIMKTPGTYTLNNGVSPAASLDFGAGSDLNGGAGGNIRCVYNGTGSGPIEISNLTGATTYTIEVYEYKGANIYLNPALTGNRSTINGTSPTDPAAALTFSNTTNNSITIQFTQAAANSGSASMLIARAGAAVNFTPVDGVSYTPNPDYSAGTDLGSGNKIIAQRLDADGVAIVMSGLTVDTDYHFAIVNYNGTAGSGAENYGTLVADVLLGNRNTEPSTLSNGFSFTSVGETGMTLNWSGNGNGDGRVVLMREGTAVLDLPLDNTTYTANGNFGFGNPPTASQIGSSYMVYDGTGSSAAVTNLKPNTTYHFAIFEYNNTTSQGVPNKVYGAVATTPGQSTAVDVTAPIPPVEVGALTVVGGTVVAGFWNSTNTQLQVTVPLPTGDGTIDGGTIQIRLKMTGGAFANIPTSGISTAISSAERVAGSKTVTINAADLENVATGFTEGNRSGLVASENKFMLIGAKVSDLAGNPSADYAQSLTKLDVDQTPPQISGSATFSDGGGGAESVTMKFTEPIGLLNNDDPLIGTPGWSTTPATTISTGGGAKYTTADSTLVLLSSANNDWSSSTTFTYTSGGAGLFIMDDYAGNEMQTVTKSTSDVTPPFLITGMVFNPNGPI